MEKKEKVKKSRKSFELKNKISEFIKNTSKKKLIAYTLAIVLVLGIIIFFCVNNFVITKMEKSTIREYNEKIEEHLDILLDDKEDGKYIIFAIRYLNNISGNDHISGEEVIKVVNDTFELKYSKDTLSKIGITPGMHSKGIMYDEANNVYTYKNEQTRTDIAATPVKKYAIKKMSKKSKTKFVVTYKVYTVENPYEILNYFNDYNSNAKEKVDTKPILDYLKGNGNISKVKALITEDNIKKFGKIDKDVKVTFVIKNEKLVLSAKK